MLIKPYVSWKYRFWFKYPLLWRRMADPDVLVLVVNTFGPETFNIIVGPCGPDYQEPQTYAREWIEENRKAGTLLELIGEESLLVDGVPGYGFNYTSPSGVTHRKVSFARSGYEYVVDYGTMHSRFTRYEPIFKQIAKSFRWF